MLNTISSNLNTFSFELFQMVRTYKRNPDARAYHSYSTEDLDNALLDMSEGKKTLRQAAAAYNIPLGTLSNNFNGKHQKNVGRPPALSSDEEHIIIEMASTCADWGFPLTTFDIRMYVQHYLKSTGNFSNFFVQKILYKHSTLSIYVFKDERSVIFWTE